MANVVVASGGFIQITHDGSTDYDMTGSANQLDKAAPNGHAIKSIQFNPSATGDIMVCREGSLTGPIIFECTCADIYDNKCKYFDQTGPKRLIKLFIEGADVTIDTAASASLLIEL